MRRKKRRYQEKLLYNHQMGSILPRELIISIFFLFLWKLKCTRIRYISLTALARHHKSDFNVAAFLMLLLSFIICMFRLFILILLPIIAHPNDFNSCKRDDLIDLSFILNDANGFYNFPSGFLLSKVSLFVIIDYIKLFGSLILDATLKGAVKWGLSKAQLYSHHMLSI